jgi:M6 family metalloprotease-like protein
MRKNLAGAQGAQKVRLFPLRLLAAIFVSSVLLSGLSAQGNSANSHRKESERAAQVRALNNSVLQLHGQMQENASSAGTVRGQASTVLGQRAAALQTLMQEDAHGALTFAFSPELLADLAEKFPSSAGLLESHVTLSGTVEHWIADSIDKKSSKESWFLNTGGGRLELHFGTAQRPGPSPTVTIEGVQVGSHVAVSKFSFTPGSSFFVIPSGMFTARNLSCILALVLAGFSLAAALRLWVRLRTSAIPGLVRQAAVCCLAMLVVALSPMGAAAQTCSTTGAQNVAVLLVTFPGVTPPSNITPQSVHDMFFSSTGPSLDGYWRAASYGQTWATGDVFGWYTLDSSYATCDNMAAVRDAAITAAANAGVPIQNYNRIFIVNTDLGCGWTGLALGQCTTLNSPNGSFTASSSFLDASWQRSQAEGAETAAHEVGHNMGLDHAQSRTFGTEALGPLGTVGTLTEYGDVFSDMGVSNIGHYAIPHKAELLNWVSPGMNYQVVQNSGTWTLQPLELNPAGLVALKVQRGTGNLAWLWVEYRQNISTYDSIWDPAGALIHYEDSTTGAHTQLLDFTPATSSTYDGALMPGSTWTDPYSNVSISVQSASANSLTVSVTYGSASSSCVSSAPTVTASPLNPSLYAGQTASYAVTVTNNDSTSCGATTFNLASTLPSGWSTSFSSSALALNPGQSASVTMDKGAPSATPAGTYAVNMSAGNSASSATDTANATVVTPPSVSISLSVTGTSFTSPGTVPITATVTNAGSPASGANVTFTVTTPTGSKVVQSAVTGSSGAATWNYKVNSKSALGTYSVVAQASLSGSGGRKNTGSAVPAAASSNAATFSVQ